MNSAKNTQRRSVLRRKHSAAEKGEQELAVYRVQDETPSSGIWLIEEVRQGPMERLSTPDELHLIASNEDLMENDEEDSDSSTSTEEDYENDGFGLDGGRRSRRRTDQLLLVEGNSDSSETEALVKAPRKMSFRMVRLFRGSSNSFAHNAESTSAGGDATAVVSTTLRGKGPFVKEVDDVEKYMASREMTKTQERWNAITMVPNPIFCLYFLMAGLWVRPEFFAAGSADASYDPLAAVAHTGPFLSTVTSVMGDSHGCLQSTWWHNMPALPPLPLIACAVGICAHAPFSFLYHWTYAHALPRGLPRITHWSRRMDHAMIHFASACLAYATSGSWDFFLANALYNADCIYRQFHKRVRPRRNKIRIFFSVLAYTVPVLRRGDFVTFFNLWVVFGISGWLFGKYPIGGWSHCAFHIVIGLAPPLIMRAALELPASQAQMRVAAQCVALAEQAAATGPLA